MLIALKSVYFFNWWIDSITTLTFASSFYVEDSFKDDHTVVSSS